MTKKNYDVPITPKMRKNIKTLLQTGKGAVPRVATKQEVLEWATLVMRGEVTGFNSADRMKSIQIMLNYYVDLAKEPEKVPVYSQNNLIVSEDIIAKHLPALFQKIVPEKDVDQIIDLEKNWCKDE